MQAQRGLYEELRQPCLPYVLFSPHVQHAVQ